MALPFTRPSMYQGPLTPGKVRTTAQKTNVELGNQGMTDHGILINGDNVASSNYIYNNPTVPVKPIQFYSLSDEAGTKAVTVNAQASFPMFAWVKANGELWTSGRHYSYQNGLNTSSGSTPISLGTGPWKDVSCGNSYLMAIKEDGTLWSTGSNTYGRTGQNTASGSTNGLTQVGSDNKWTKIFCADSHAVGLKSDGTAWVWGYNATGRTALGTTSGNTLVPTQIGTASNWVGAAVSVQTTYLTNSDGVVFGAGWYNYGCLNGGYATYNASQSSLVQVTKNDVFVTKIACNQLGYGGAALLNDGRIMTFGSGTEANCVFDRSGNVPTFPFGDSTFTYLKGLNSGYIAQRNDGAVFYSSRMADFPACIRVEYDNGPYSSTGRSPYGDNTTYSAFSIADRFFLGFFPPIIAADGGASGTIIAY